MVLKRLLTMLYSSRTRKSKPVELANSLTKISAKATFLAFADEERSKASDDRLPFLDDQRNHPAITYYINKPALLKNNFKVTEQANARFKHYN